jgi:hypothetical protein
MECAGRVLHERRSPANRLFSLLWVDQAGGAWPSRYARRCFVGSSAGFLYGSFPARLNLWTLRPPIVSPAIRLPFESTEIVCK